MSRHPDVPHLRLLRCRFPGPGICRNTPRYIVTFRDKPADYKEYACEEHGMVPAHDARSGIYLTPIEGSWEKYLENESKGK